MKRRHPYTLPTLLKYRLTQLGNTLIEILLVITIIATITVLSVRGIQQQTLQTKIAVTTEQVQSMAVAARAYYESLQSQWPEKLDDLKSFFPPNLLQTPLANPWGYPIALPDDPMVRPYYIKTTVPDLAIAQRLHGRLPISTYHADAGTTYEIRLYLTTPSSLSWQGINLGAKIHAIQMINVTSQTDYTVSDFDCPEHTLPNWAAGMVSFAKDHQEGNGEFVSGVTLCTTHSDDSICPGTKKPVLNNQIRLRMTRWTGEYEANANVLLLQYCTPMS